MKLSRWAPAAVGLVCLGLQLALVPKPPQQPPPRSGPEFVLQAWPASSTLKLSHRDTDPLQGQGSLTIPRQNPWFKEGSSSGVTTLETKGVLTVTNPGFQPFSAQDKDIQSLEGHWIQLTPCWWTKLFFHAGWLALALGVAICLRPASKPQEEVVPLVGPYPLKGEPLRGSMGQVYRSTDGQGHEVALKVMNPQVSESDEFRQRFLREASICESLQHPALVKVHSHGEHEGRLYMALEWIDGSSLDRLPLPQKPAHVKALLLQICQGLEAAHSQNIVHRDLKPANILLRRDGRPVIADFGLARGARYETITQTEATLGTPAYMPPEQIRGQRSGPRADLYSLGCIGYLLLTGRLPFSHADPIPLMLMHLNQAPPPTGVDPNWDRLLLALLEKDPERRPASAAEVVNMLEALPTSADSEA